jgi:hypothetical protein
VLRVNPVFGGGMLAGVGRNSGSAEPLRDATIMVRIQLSRAMAQFVRSKFVYSVENVAVKRPCQKSVDPRLTKYVPYRRETMPGDVSLRSTSNTVFFLSSRPITECAER